MLLLIFHCFERLAIIIMLVMSLSTIAILLQCCTSKKKVRCEECENRRERRLIKHQMKLHRKHRKLHKKPGSSPLNQPHNKPESSQKDEQKDQTPPPYSLLEIGALDIATVSDQMPKKVNQRVVDSKYLVQENADTATLSDQTPKKVSQRVKDSIYSVQEIGDIATVSNPMPENFNQRSLEQYKGGHKFSENEDTYQTLEEGKISGKKQR